MHARKLSPQQFLAKQRSEPSRNRLRFPPLFSAGLPIYRSISWRVVASSREIQPHYRDGRAPDLGVSLAEQEGELVVDILRGLDRY